MTKRIVIVGAAGYSGAELVSILLGHPRVEIVGLFGSARRGGSGGTFRTLADVFPRFRNRIDLPLHAADPKEIAALRPDAVFLATPHEASMELAPELLETGLRVLDLSAAFRFRDASVYPTHYGFTHTQPGLLETAVYGLPELNRHRIRTAMLIAVPGCYPTSSILPLSPIISAGALRLDAGVPRRPIIDSTSGVSGAGRALKESSLFCEVSLQPYGVFSHRHTPEISAYCGAPVIFTPHLGAYERGILSTIHMDLAEGWTGERVSHTLHQAYEREPFVRLCRPGTWPAVADVRHTNFCDVGWAVEENSGHLIIASAIDNLTKGAAGQAVQCMNLCFDFSEPSGLASLPTN